VANSADAMTDTRRSIIGAICERAVSRR
jgi:hypothetical protein